MEVCRRSSRKLKVRLNSGFFYSSDDLPANQRFTIDLDNAGINQTLSALFNGTHLNWKLIPSYKVVITLSNQPFIASAKYKRVTGVVRAESGSPPIGASLKGKKKNKGSSTHNERHLTI